MKESCRITDLALLGSVKTISAYTGAQIAFDENTEKDQISGTVTTENAGFLFLPIPYSKNVKAYVDGIKTDVLRADACSSVFRSAQENTPLHFTGSEHFL